MGRSTSNEYSRAISHTPAGLRKLLVTTLFSRLVISFIFTAPFDTIQSRLRLVEAHQVQGIVRSQSKALPSFVVKISTSRHPLFYLVHTSFGTSACNKLPCWILRFCYLMFSSWGFVNTLVHHVCSARGNAIFNQTNCMWTLQSHPWNHPLIMTDLSYLTTFLMSHGWLPIIY